MSKSGIHDYNNANSSSEASATSEDDTVSRSATKSAKDTDLSTNEEKPPPQEHSLLISSVGSQEYERAIWSPLFESNTFVRVEIENAALYPRASLISDLRSYSQLENIEQYVPTITGTELRILKIVDVIRDRQRERQFDKDADEFWRMIGSGFPKLEELIVSQWSESTHHFFGPKHLEFLIGLNLKKLSIRTGTHTWSSKDFEHLKSFAYTLEYLELGNFSLNDSAKDFLRKFPRLKKAKINGVEYDFPL